MMLDRSEFYARRTACKACEFWQGACLKGHQLHGSFGCPIQKFEGSAGYLPDVPIPQPKLPPQGGCGECKGKTEDLKPLTWNEVWKHLRHSLETWKEAGFPLTPLADYRERIRRCKSCPQGQYKWYQCRHCKCIVYSKAALATEGCPLQVWRPQ